MDENEYQAGVAQLRNDWGALQQDGQTPGILRADNDSTTGILVGMRAKVVAEIINRALAASTDGKGVG